MGYTVIMNIRYATIADIPSLFALSCKVHRLTPYDTLIPVEQRDRFLSAYTPGSRLEAKLHAKFIHFMNVPENYIYVAEIDGRVVGYRLAERRGDSVYMHGLFVDPDYQGRGIGRRLFVEPLSQAKPGDTIYLTVLRGNERARKLYESEGFCVIGENPARFYGAIQDDMSRKIDS
ncbi:GNAT family N-acetyltransferase [Candidatus Saccharibacteria bacterium]|nr:GNAT family N-acetyltransferase [Candidatus Saccharibacteria bacterium]